MKKIALLLAFLACFAATAFGQSNPPLRVTEPDGVPNVSGVTTLKFSNGSVTCSGKVCTVVTGGGGGGTVTSISVVSANGLAGTVATATTTPAITLSTTITGILSGNGTAISAASTTGSGAVVLATSPALVTPVLGVASSTSLSLTGTAGAGFLEIANQSSKPATPTTAGRLYWDNSNRLSWIGTNGFIRTFDGTANLADRVYTLQDSTGTIAMLEAAESFSGQQTFANGVTTGTGTSSGTVFAYNSLTTGAGANFSSSSVTTGNIVNIASTSTAAASNTLTGLNIAISGANGTTAQTVRGTVISVTNTNATSGTNAALTLTASGATTANQAINVTAGSIVQTSNLATAFESGPNGSTNPVLRLVNSTASQADGVSITGLAAGSGATFTALSSGSNAPLTFTTKGTGINTFTSNSNGDLMKMGTNGSYLWNDAGAGPSLVLSANASRSVTYLSLQTRANKALLVIGSTGMYGFGSWTSFAESADTGIVRNAAGAIRVNDGQTSGTPNTSAGNLILGTSSGAIGSSGAGVLAFALSTAPTTSPTSTVQLWSVAAATNDAQLYSRDEAGEINRLTGLSARNSAQFDVTSSTTLTNVTGLTRNVEAGRTYAFHAYLQTTANVAGGVQFSVSGTATATAISYEGLLSGGAAIVAQTRATALDTVVCASTTTTAGTCVVEGVFQVNAAGTFTIKFAQNVSNGSASSVLANQYLQLIPIT